MKGRLAKLVSALLAALFAYKALEEAHLDMLWALIYILVSLDYALELVKRL